MPFLRLVPLQSLPQTETQESAKAHCGDSGRTQANPHGDTYHNRWQELIDGPMDRLLRMLTEPSEEASTLRRESPFTTLVPSDERRRVFESLRTAA